MSMFVRSNERKFSKSRGRNETNRWHRSRQISDSRERCNDDAHTHSSRQRPSRGHLQHQEVLQIEHQESKQMTLTVETQMLLDQTQTLVGGIMDFAEALQSNANVEFANKKAVGLCNAFGMACEGFYEDEVLNEQAIGLSADMILQLEASVSTTRYRNEFEYLDPLINYAKRAIKGEKTQNLRGVLTASRPKWSEEVANRTMQSYQAANHAVEARHSQIRRDENEYRRAHSLKWDELGRTLPQVGEIRPTETLDSFYRALGAPGSLRYDDSEVVEDDYDMDVDGAPNL